MPAPHGPDRRAGRRALYLLLVPWLRKMTGPSAIRLVTSDFTVLGRGVVKVYGVSTLGSMLGATLTGFVLIPGFAVSTLLISCAVVLLAVGGIGLVLARRTLGGAGAASAAALAATSAVRGPLPPSNVLYVGNSFYGELKVVETPGHRVLLIDSWDRYCRARLWS